MNTIFSRNRTKKERPSSSNDVGTQENSIYYLGPKKRSSQETLVFNRLDSSQENYGELAGNLSAVNRSINAVVRNIVNNEYPYQERRRRRRSSSHLYDNDSDDTAASVDSLQMEGFKIFGKDLNEYNSKRNMPIISLALKTGLLIFPSEEAVSHFKKSHKWRIRGSMERSSSVSATSSSTQVSDLRNSRTRSSQDLGRYSDSSAILDDEDYADSEYQYEEDSGIPLFHISVPLLSQFRKKCPYLIISKYYIASELRERALNEPNATDSLVKYTFCKVYDKYIKIGVKRFIMEFTPNPKSPDETFKVVMFTHRSKPYTDSIYKGTKLRFVGTSVGSSAFGSSTIQLMVMNEAGALSLMDDMTEDDKPSPNNPLLKEGTNLTDISGGSLNFKLYGNSTLPPLAKFSDNVGDLQPRKIQQVGDISCYEAINLRDRNDLYGDFNNVKRVKLDTMVLTCMLLVLREQENKKNPRAIGSQLPRGAPYYGNLAGVYGTFSTPFTFGGPV